MPPPPLLQDSVGWLGYCFLLGGWLALLAWAVVRMIWARSQDQVALPSPPRVAIRVLTFLLALLAVVGAVFTSQAPPDIAALVAASATWIALAFVSEAERALGAKEMGLCIRAGTNWAAILVATSWYASFAAAFDASSSECEASRRRMVLGLWSVSLFLAIILAIIGLQAPGSSISMSNDIANPKTASLVEGGVVDPADAGPPSPEPGASLLDLLTFGWMRPVLLTGRKRALEFKDIFELVPQDRCEANSAALASAWASEVDVVGRGIDKENTESTARTPSATAHRVELEAKTSVLRTILLRCCGRRLLKLATLRAFAIVVTFAQPLALGAVISSVGAGSSSEPRGRRAWLTFTYAVLLFGLSFLSAVLDSHCSYAMQRLATQQRLGMQRFLFLKALKLSGSARQSLGTGAIVSHLQMDCRLVSQGVVVVHQIWSIPLQLAICLTLLYQQLGVSAFAGLGITVLMSPVMFFCARAARRARRLVMRRRDSRLKFLTELLQGARSLKLFAWEVQARDRVSALRRLEVDAIQATQLWSACTQGLANAIPLLVAVVTFATFSVLSSNNEDGSGDLTPSRAFVSLTLLGLLGAPLAKIPVFMTSVLGMMVAAQRLNSFLHAEEFAEIVVDDDVSSTGPKKDDILLNQLKALPTSDRVFTTARSPLFELTNDLESASYLEENSHQKEVSIDGLSDAKTSALLAKISAHTHETNDASLKARQQQYIRYLSPSSGADSDAVVAIAGGSPGAALAIGGPASFAWPSYLADMNSSDLSNAKGGKGGKGGKGKGGKGGKDGKGGKGSKGGKGEKGSGGGKGSGKGGNGGKGEKSSRGKGAKADEQQPYSNDGSQRRQAVLRGVALSIPAGSLVAVVGRVGSGKSSLLAALLHELEATEVAGSDLQSIGETRGQTDATSQPHMQGPPRVAVCGSVAYCAQEPWIQNTTLRSNICFSRAFDPVRYATIIEACALQPDLQQLPNGDETQIGERGLTLSGGQKARVALARALYVDADVFLLDDVLAAVDQHVQRHLLHHILLPPHGLLRHSPAPTAINTPGRSAPGFGVKTVVVVTNQLEWISKADFVIALGGGGSGGDTGASKNDKDEACCVLAWGRPEELRESGVDVMALVRSDARKWAGATIEEEFIAEKFVGDDTTANASESFGDYTLSKGIENSSEKQTLDNNAAVLAAEKSASIQARDSKAARPDKEVVSTGDDIRLKGAVKTEIWAGYAGALGFQWSALLLILYTVAQFSRTGGDLVIAYWSMATNENDQVFFLTLYAGATGVAAAVVFARAVALVFANLRAATKAHDSALWAILRSPMDFFDTTTSGRVLNRFSSDLQQVDMQLRALAASLLTSTFQLLAGLVVVAATTPPALLVLPPFACFYFELQRDYRSSATEAQRLQSLSRSPVLQQVSELIAGLTTVRAFRYAAVARTNMTDLIDRQARAIRCTSTLSRWLAFRLELLGSVVVLAVAISAGITDATTTEGADAALIGLSLSYAIQFTSYLNGFLKSITDMELGLVAIERLHQYAQLPCEASLTLPQPPVSELITNANVEMVDLESSPKVRFENEEEENYDPPPDWPARGAVSFKGVSMRYRPGLPEVLTDLSFEASPGQNIGIVGRTGSGKSTILAALFRLPSIGLSSGVITIDGFNIASVGLHTLRKRISIVPQDPVLLSGSLRANLDPFGEYPDAELKSSLVAVGLWDTLTQRNAADDSSKLSDSNRDQNRKESLETLNSEDWSVLEFAVSSYGENLSVGQRQLLCIARALLRQCKVAVLDEATAAIDKATDELIQLTLTTALSASTVLTVAHRLDTIAQSDKVLVMDDGTAAEFGHPDDLLSDPNSHFFALWHGHKHKKS